MEDCLLVFSLKGLLSVAFGLVLGVAFGLFLSSTGALLFLLLWWLPVQQVQNFSLVATGIKLDCHNTLFINVSKIANHMLHVYMIRLSLVLRFQPFYADFLLPLSHLLHRL